MKKNVRTLLALVLAFALIMPVTEVFANEIPENTRVEIVFKLGENTLKINGNPVEVQTPYAVGVGVTLVPVRVITEAFGAKVDWDGATQSIPIEYRGVNILLQIGNPIAEVNGTPETLLAPPEISGQSTMVPLRFISETFGATVSYNNENGEIIVTKEASEEGTMVEGRVDSLRIGDSYYGWSMENPSDLTIDRGFDGGYTYFEYDEDNWIGVVVTKLEDDYSFEEDFSNLKSEASKYTLVAADKDTKDPTVKKAYVKYKDKVFTGEDYIYVANGYRFNVYAMFDNELKTEQSDASRIIATFKPSFTTEDTHDLSNVKNGFRTYTSESMKFSINVPAEFAISSDEYIENDVSFISKEKDDKYSTVYFNVYSKSEVGSAEELCNKDHKSNKSKSNEEISRFKSPTEAKYSGFSGYEYTFSYKGESINTTTTDAFFEVGDYTYNVNVTIDNDARSDFEKISQSILNSVKVTPLDSEETGILMRYEPDENTTYTIKGDKWSVKVPERFEKQYATDESTLIGDMYTGTTISIELTNSSGKRRNSDLVDDLKVLEDGVRNDGNSTVISQTGKTTAGIYTYNSMSFKTHKKGSMLLYTAVFNALRGGKEISVIVIIPETGYSANTRQLYSDVLESIVVEP